MISVAGDQPSAGRPLLSSRLAGLGTTIFAEMSALAVATGAVNLGQGFPDVDGPAEIAQIAAAAILEGRANQYAPGPGIGELRAAVAAHQKRFYGVELDPDREVLITVGASEAIAAALIALLDPGDEVIVFEPYYDCYPACVAMPSARRVTVTLRPPDFRPDLDSLEAAITSRTRMILLNTPHNPTGVVFSKDELAKIAALACEHDLLVVTDEVYEHLIYDGAHVPIATFPGMFDRTVTISSAAKTFSFTGWKVGWVTASADLVTAVRTAKQYLTFTASGPFQYAVADALGLPDQYYASVSDELRVKRDFLSAGLAKAGFDVYQPAATYFVTTDVRPLGWSDGMRFCLELPHRAGVAAIPNVVFYDDKEVGKPQVRFTFCKRQEVLSQALERLSAPGLVAADKPIRASS